MDSFTISHPSCPAPGTSGVCCSDGRLESLVQFVALAQSNVNCITGEQIHDLGGQQHSGFADSQS